MRTRILVALGPALLFTAGTAHALTNTIYDETLVYGYRTNSSDPNNATPVGPGSQYAWTDIVGNQSFNTKKVEITRESGDLTIKIYTNYGLNTGTDANGANPQESQFPMSDIAFDLDGDMHFEYGFAMTTRDTFTRGSLYNVTDASGWTTSWDTSLDIYDNNGGLTIGGRYDNCTKGLDCPLPPHNTQPPFVPVVKLDSATLVQAGTVGQSATGDPSSEYNDPSNLDASRYVITVTLAGLLDQNQEWNGDFNMLFGTAGCANDTVWAEVPAVPIPAALPMLLAAVGGLGFAGWRRRSA